MTATEYHLKWIIYRWCGADPTKYVPDSQLRDIWTGNAPSQILYEPEGIHRFFTVLYQDPFFSSCPSAQHLRPGEFVKGGDLQTVMQLYVRLLPCGNVPINPSGEAQFE